MFARVSEETEEETLACEAVQAGRFLRQTPSLYLKVKFTGTCLSQQAKFTCQIARKPHC